MAASRITHLAARLMVSPNSVYSARLREPTHAHSSRPVVTPTAARSPTSCTVQGNSLCPDGASICAADAVLTPEERQIKQESSLPACRERSGAPRKRRAQGHRRGSGPVGQTHRPPGTLSRRIAAVQPMQQNLEQLQLEVLVMSKCTCCVRMPAPLNAISSSVDLTTFAQVVCTVQHSTRSPAGTCHHAPACGAEPAALPVARCLGWACLLFASPPGDPLIINVKVSTSS